MKGTYIELFGYPLSGKSTFIQKLATKNKDFHFVLANTDKGLTKILTTIYFITQNRILLKLFLSLPLNKNNFFPSLRKFLSFSKRYSDYRKFQRSNENHILDEGLCQGIWGLLSSFDYHKENIKLRKLIDLYFDTLLVDDNLIIVQMDVLTIEEFRKRSENRSFHHSYIRHRLNNNSRKLVDYDQCYALIINKALELNSLISHKDILAMSGLQNFSFDDCQ